MIANTEIVYANLVNGHAIRYFSESNMFFVYTDREAIEVPASVIDTLYRVDTVARAYAEAYRRLLAGAEIVPL